MYSVHCTSFLYSRTVKYEVQKKKMIAKVRKKEKKVLTKLRSVCFRR